MSATIFFADVRAAMGVPSFRFRLTEVSRYMVNEDALDRGEGPIVISDEYPFFNILASNDRTTFI